MLCVLGGGGCSFSEVRVCRLPSLQTLKGFWLLTLALIPSVLGFFGENLGHFFGLPKS